MDIFQNFSLQHFNTFGLSARAQRFATMHSMEDIFEYLALNPHSTEPVLVLGGGSNILFTQDFSGTMLKIAIPGIHIVKEDPHYFWVKVGAGVSWHDLVKSCIKANMGGLENLSLIPGTVGAAPVQNIGAYGVELKDTFEALEAIELSTAKKHYFRNHECRFGYRDSIFKNELRDKFIITNVVFRLRKSPLLQTSYGSVQDELAKKGIVTASIRDVSDAIIRIRKSKLPDPAEVGNAGSFFKNPVISKALFNILKKSFPLITNFPQEDGTVKLAAAWLIDECGLKGFSIGGAAVHDKQPLVIVNRHRATGNEILQVARVVQQKVMEKFAVELETEVRIL